MTTRWLVLGTDARMKQLAKFLTDDERTVYYKCTDKWTEEINQLTARYEPQRIILPIQPLFVEVEKLQGVEQGIVFVGKLTTQWQELLAGCDVQHYLQQEAFIWQNAALTAEAMLAHFYQGGKSMQYKKVLITGFGRVAKMLANLLVRLHVDVLIAVRSEVQRAEAQAYGYEAYILDETLQVAADYCINTIPAAWFDERFQQSLRMPIFDLASAPGCLRNIECAEYELLPALPGKYFAYDAAQLLYETILQLEGEGRCLKENELA